MELLYLLAGTAARRDELAARTRAVLARVDDGERLARLLADRRLLPLIGTRALETAGEGGCPPGFAAAVHAARAAARARGLATEADTRRVVGHLAEHDIPALPLKGPLLAQAAHGDVGLRESGDIDLLVPRALLGDAARVLLAEGFEPPTDPLRANALPDLHLALRHAERPTVELHWRVHWHEQRFSEAMLASAQPAADGVLRATPRDIAASLLLFYARDGFHGVRLAADLAGWWDRSGGRELTPAPLEEPARSEPAIAPALTAAATVAERLTGVPARGWLGDAGATGHRVALSVRLADWTQAGDRDQLAANISLAGGLLAPARAAPAFARRELVPRSGAAIPHASKMIARYGTALWRVRGGRRWSDPPVCHV